MSESKTFYRDNISGLTKDDEDRIDTFAASLGFGPKYTPTPRKEHQCPSCKGKKAYYKEIHPDTDMNEIVLHCSDCNFEE